MTKRTGTFDAMIAVQIVLAVFLFTLGIIGIMYWNSDISRFGRGVNRLFGRASNPFNIFMAVVEIAAGVVVFAGVFVTLKSRLLYWLTIVIAIVWILEIIIVFFAQGIFEPDFLVWLNRLSADLIILLALWLINRRYA
jgi:hypothetical protein